MAVVLKASFFYDVETSRDTVKVTLKKPNQNRKVVFLETFPVGGWTELVFDELDGVSLTKFLSTMVFNNLDVLRFRARVSLTRVQDATRRHNIQLMNAIRILDYTFVPPTVNTNCKWQMELVENIVSKQSRVVIATSNNYKRLERYCDALDAIKC